jgi:amino acid transporter
MIMIPYILICLTLLVLVTKWRIEDTFAWGDWAFFSLVLIGLSGVFTYSIFV